VDWKVGRCPASVSCRAKASHPRLAWHRRRQRTSDVMPLEGPWSERARGVPPIWIMFIPGFEAARQWDHISSTVPRSHGPTVPRSHGPTVPRSHGPTVPRSPKGCRANMPSPDPPILALHGVRRYRLCPLAGARPVPRPARKVPSRQVAATFDFIGVPRCRVKLVSWWSRRVNPTRSGPIFHSYCCHLASPRWGAMGRSE
jgi:hypothetical protein